MVKKLNIFFCKNQFSEKFKLKTILKKKVFWKYGFLK